MLLPNKKAIKYKQIFKIKYKLNKSINNTKFFINL